MKEKGPAFAGPSVFLACCVLAFVPPVIGRREKPVAQPPFEIRVFGEFLVEFRVHNLSLAVVSEKVYADSIELTSEQWDALMSRIQSQGWWSCYSICIGFVADARGQSLCG